LTSSRESVQLFNDTGVRLLERFYDSLKTGELVDPIDIPSSDQYYIWVALKSRFPGITLGEAAAALYLEGYTSLKGSLLLTQ